MLFHFLLFNSAESFHESFHEELFFMSSILFNVDNLCWVTIAAISTTDMYSVCKKHVYVVLFHFLISFINASLPPCWVEVRPNLTAFASGLPVG